ncbi:MAG: hypothetical protein ACREX3_14175 [Gammaproteobacteria bacterium]
MEKIDTHDKEESIKRLMRLASAVYELARHANDSRQLELLRKMAAPLKSLLDDQEGALQHPNLGLELNEYVQIKEYDEHDESGWVQMYGEATEARFKAIDSWLHFTKDL